MITHLLFFFFLETEAEASVGGSGTGGTIFGEGALGEGGLGESGTFIEVIDPEEPPVTTPYLFVILEDSSTYVFKASLYVTADATGGHKYAIEGTCIPLVIIFQIISVDKDLNTAVINQTLQALGGSAGGAGATRIYTEITGTIVVDTGGILRVQFAQQATGDPATLLAGSSLEVRKVA